MTPTSSLIKFSNYVVMQFWYPCYMSQFVLDFFCGAIAQIGPTTPSFWGSSLSLSHLYIRYVSSEACSQGHYLHKKHNRRTSAPSEGFKPSIAVTKWIQSHVLRVVRTTIGMSPVFNNVHIIISYRIQTTKYTVIFQYPLQLMSLPPHQFLA